MRLNLSIFILLLAIFSLIFLKILYTTAGDLQEEVVSRFDLSNQVIEAQINNIKRHSAELNDRSPERILGLLNLKQFADVKFIKFELFNSDEQLISTNSRNIIASSIWFFERIEHVFIFGLFQPIERKVYSIDLDQTHQGKLIVSVDIDSKLEALWTKTLTKVSPIGFLFIVVFIVITLMMTFIIKPLTEFLTGVNQDSTVKGAKPNKLSLFSYASELPKRLHDIRNQLTDSNREVHDIKNQLTDSSREVYDIRNQLTDSSREVHDIRNQLTDSSREVHDIRNQLTDSSREVHDLNNRILRLQEDERRHLSAEIHDELGQHLTAIRFEAEVIKTVKNIEEARQSAEAIDAIGRDMRDIVRSMLRRLHPPELELFGLQASITEMVADWGLRHPKSKIDFKCDADFSQLNQEYQLNIYRIVQEGLTNISRHAGSTGLNITISLLSLYDQIKILIVDDGQGCDLTQRSSGFGLNGMRERVESCAGTITLNSNPNQGMNIEIAIPIPNIKRETT